MNDQASAYMVQGFFFQERMMLGIGYRPVIGTVAVVNQALVRDMFSGIFGPSDSSDEWVGSLVDAFGDSVLSNVELSDTELHFDKRYEDHEDTIHYAFRRDGDLWIGEYSGEHVGRGYANCIVTPIPERMFEPS